MASEIKPDGRVVAPLNITHPTPAFDLKGFRFRPTDSLNLAPRTGGEQPGDDSSDHPKFAASRLEVQGGPPGRGGFPGRGPPVRPPPPGPAPAPAPQLPPDHQQIDKQLGIAGDTRPPPLPFPLAQFRGAYAGNGFNLIFRPVPFPGGVEITSDGPRDNHLELNLTTEQLTFGPTLGEIPNRGFGKQADIMLGGLPYLQTVQNVTNDQTGLPDKPVPNDIHFEPGVWLTVPPAESFQTTDELKRGSVARMGSIPHGTTINAQGVIPVKNPNTPLGGKPGGPEIPPIDTTPFHLLDRNRKFTFQNMSAESSNGTGEGEGPGINRFRTPSNLNKFKETGRITTDIIKNPNLVLINATKGQNITETISFEVHTGDASRGAKLNGGGAASIAFLHGKQSEVTTAAPTVNDMPNAHVPFMSSQFWIETVQYDVTVPRLGPNDTVILRPTMPKDSTAPTPQFAITAPPKGVPAQTTITVPGVQIQYSQVVHLTFGPNAGIMLVWPHASVATLVPTGPQPFKMT